MIGRFAPSPTGSLHLGSLRTALAAWLLARSAGSRFHLRVEDLDPQRSRAELESAQLADLAALGLDWDGPVLRQSERRHLYEAALARLDAEGRLYPCFCTRAEIRAAASAPHGAAPGGAYPGTCRALSPAQRRRRIEAGAAHALRVDAGAPRIAHEDRLLGRCETVVDDFVVRRADGVPAYQLAVVIDDAAQGIEEVVRGADLADSTARQILLHRWLALPTPRYAHVGLVLGRDGSRLAKRDRGVTLAERAEPPAATLAWLAESLGLEAVADGDPRGLLPGFDPASLRRGPVTLPD